MPERQFNVYQDKAGPRHGHVKAWTKGVQIEQEAIEQLLNCASLPFIFKHVAAMPDAHWGMGSTVGSVIPTKGAIIPAAVGVDIGCGMLAYRTNLTKNDFWTEQGWDIGDAEWLVDMPRLRARIESYVPHGRTHNGEIGKDEGQWSPDHWHRIGGPRRIYEAAVEWRKYLIHGYEQITKVAPKIDRGATWTQLGTLGGGNHFCELTYDKEGRVWVFIHSGSRGPGARIGNHYMREAKALAKMFMSDLPDPHLAFLPEGHPLFEEYMFAVRWAQRYAKKSRAIMAKNTLRALADELGREILTDQEIDCHHNFVQRENHFGQNILVTRKGATSAREGEWGLIPGSMGTGSFIVKGKGCKTAFQSCSHGAGRAMSRTAARKKFTVDDHIAATRGVECRKDEEVIDETPMAYKDINAVMAAQTELVDVVTKLTTFLCIKG